LKLSKADEAFQLVSDLLIWGWAGIAEELNISERSARYWWRKYNMPVRFSPSGRVFSFPQELKGWLYLYSEVQRGVPLEKAGERLLRALNGR